MNKTHRIVDSLLRWTPRVGLIAVASGLTFGVAQAEDNYSESTAPEEEDEKRMVVPSQKPKKKNRNADLKIPHCPL